MNHLQRFSSAFSRWIDDVAATAQTIVNRYRSRPVIELIEGEDGSLTFHVAASGVPPPADRRISIADGNIVEPLPADWNSILRGSAVEVILQPTRFVFRPLELPRRAGEFLDGLIRGQIDRLTPWAASEAVFSWTLPVESARERIQLTVAATASAMVAPFLAMVGDLGAASVAIFTVVQDAGSAGARVKICERQTQKSFEVARIRSVLVTVFAATALAAALAIGVSIVATDSLDADQQELLRKVAARRAMLRTELNPVGGSALALLQRQKQTTPAAVIVLEALSELLPDHTYLTEFHIDGDKVQIVGVTRDAPSLIELLEQSTHFTRATFYAPTTRLPGEPGERFHIEAHIAPQFG